jgi:RNA polymerase sigma factor (TIGR02999 family)
VPPRAPDVTQLLQKASLGDKQAEADLLARVYRELHSIAIGHLRRERPGHTLQATALVHEAYLRLTLKADSDWKSRAQFFGFAAQTMRSILVDYARRKGAAKRGGNSVHASIEEGAIVSSAHSELIEEMDEALKRLELLSPRQARVVELRFFTGLTEAEIAEVLDVSERTVKRDWRLARAWLHGELRSK